MVVATRRAAWHRWPAGGGTAGRPRGTGRTEATSAIPFHRWPLGRGFERFYGFLGGETNQWYPDLTRTTPVSDDHGPKTSAFTGRVRWVQIDLEADDNDHLISPEERLRIAMAKQ